MFGSMKLPPSPRAIYASSLLMTTTLALGSPLAESPYRLEIVGPWTVEGGMKKKKEGVSAAAMLDGRHGLLATDEGSLVQPFVLDPSRNAITVSKGFTLLEGKEEMDIEAMCSAPEIGTYFVTGSHALGRKNGLLQESRYRIYRVTPGKSGVRPALREGSLRSVLKSLPELRPFLDLPAPANGIDVEGMAWKNGRLYIGFRSPVLADGACLLEVDPACIFEGLAPTGRLHRVKLPAGNGIRSLSPVKEGLLLLTGDQGAAKADGVPSLYLWKLDQEDPILLGAVPTGGAKPEAIVLLSESETTLRLLMMSDGADNGAPIALQIARKPASGS